MTGSTYIALLRGINVGGRNKLPMKSLVAIFQRAGCAEVRTYIQSGNVVYKAPKEVAAGVPSAVSGAIEKTLSLKVPVVTRTAAELSRIVASNPFMTTGVDTKALHIAFLSETPAEARLAGLDPDRSPPDTFRLQGREIYLFCPNGLARTRLTNDYFDKTLSLTSTIRNWNTVQRLQVMSTT